MRIDNPKISAVLITNDDLDCIGAVESVLDTCFEVIVINTVDTWKIKPILEKIDKVKLLYFKWTDNFSAARNYGIDNASGDWILTIDSDERLSTPIKYLDDKFTAYSTKQKNKGYAYFTARLFKNLPEIRYKNKIHETIDHCLTPENHCECDITMDHTGYEITPEQMKAKMKRNNDIMKTDKGNIIRNLHMGNYEFHENQDYNKAYSYYKKALKDGLNDEHMAVIWINIHACQFKMKADINVLLDALKKSIMYEPFQLYCRVNIVEHLLSVMTDENKETYLYQIRRELSKIENIFQYGISNLIIPDLEVNQDYIDEKYQILSKWGIERVAV